MGKMSKTKYHILVKFIMRILTTVGESEDIKVHLHRDIETSCPPEFRVISEEELLARINKRIYIILKAHPDGKIIRFSDGRLDKRPTLFIDQANINPSLEFVYWYTYDVDTCETTWKQLQRHPRFDCSVLTSRDENHHTQRCFLKALGQ
jgi:hypothetical protein